MADHDRARPALGAGRRTRGTRGTRGGRRARRGAVLPLFLFLFVVLVASAAVAVDLGQLRVVATEVQTAADAGASAATYAVQHAAESPTPDPAGAAAAAAVAVGRANRAAGAPARVTAGDVLPKRLDPTGDVLTDTAWAAANAVQVTARATPRYAFAGMLGLAPPVVTRRATGAFMRVVGMSCVRPLLIPYYRLYNRAFGTSYAWNQSAPDMTPAQLQAFGDMDPTHRSFTFVGPGVPPPGSKRDYDGNWLPVDFTGGAGTMASFTDWAQGVNCADAQAVVRRPKGAISKAAAANDFITALTQAMASVCVRGSDKNDTAKCYASADATQPGVTIRIVAGDVTSTAPGAPITVRMVTTMTLMCYFTSETDHCQWEHTWPEAPGYWQPPLDGNGNQYPNGTFVVLANRPFPGRIPYTPDMVFGADNPMAPTVTGGPLQTRLTFLAR